MFYYLVPGFGVLVAGTTQVLPVDSVCLSRDQAVRHAIRFPVHADESSPLAKLEAVEILKESSEVK